MNSSSKENENEDPIFSLSPVPLTDRREQAESTGFLSSFYEDMDKEMSWKRGDRRGLGDPTISTLPDFDVIVQFADVIIRRKKNTPP